MVVILAIEYINGDKEQICCDDCIEGKTSLTYSIRFGVNQGEYHIPYSSIKKWSVKK